MDCHGRVASQDAKGQLSEARNSLDRLQSVMAHRLLGDEGMTKTPNSTETSTLVIHKRQLRPKESPLQLWE